MEEDEYLLDFSSQNLAPGLPSQKSLESRVLCEEKLVVWSPIHIRIEKHWENNLLS